ncbi:MAG: pyridoxine 5'-phosphate synthase [Saprospiraceae bacterium]|nr:pyridoxine 5'-phosphate synthase [Saprospiraceae bacterium]
MDTKLSVNVNKIALIRNSRGSDYPNLLTMCLDLEAYGAEGITVHPRPDQRHIRYDDIPVLKEHIRTELNIEGYPSDDFIRLVLDNRPAQVTLVPDLPGALTSDHGWNFQKDGNFLKTIIPVFKTSGIRVSLFVDAGEDNADMALDTGADRIELYTGPFAHAFEIEQRGDIAAHIATSQRAMDIGIGVNAGHDLNLKNLAFYAHSLPFLQEVSIGHALIVDAMYYGYSNAIQMYKDRLAHPEHYLPYIS